MFIKFFLEDKTFLVEKILFTKYFHDKIVAVNRYGIPQGRRVIRIMLWDHINPNKFLFLLVCFNA